MQRNLLILVFFLAEIIIAHKLAPTAIGSYYEGVKSVGHEITFTGIGSHDNDGQYGGYSQQWRWDFNYDGTFNYEVGYSTSLASHEYSSPGNYTVALQYRDNDGQLSSLYTFNIEILEHSRAYYLKDHLGNIRVTVDAKGEAIGWDDYYPFGKQMPGRSINSSNPNDLYKFTGKERDKEENLNLDNIGVRTYDSEIGIWYTLDPLMNKYPSHSPYNYVFNNPINIIDPDGRDTISTRAVGIYNHETNTESVVETVVNELGNAGNPANGNTTLTTTNVVTILPNGKVNVGNTTISSNPLRSDITSSITNGGVKLMTKEMQKYVSTSANLMRTTGMGSVRAFATDFNIARPKQIRKENMFNIGATVVFGFLSGGPSTQITSFIGGAGYAQSVLGIYKNLQFVPISTNDNIIQRLK